MIHKGDFYKMIDLFLVSFIALYFEILLIRWIPSSVQIVAYFTNIILISSFFGLGLGCLLVEVKSDLMRFFPACILILVTMVLGIGNMPIKANLISGEHLLGFYKSQGINFLAVIVVIFIFNALLFIPLGQKLGKCLKYFKPLVAYSINIVGSIAGVAVFSLLSYLMLKPFHWFLCGLLVTLWFYAADAKRLLVKGLILAVALFIVATANTHSYWSPYYKIDILPNISQFSHKTLGLFISANNTYHQFAFNLTDNSVQELPELKHYKEVYEFPYRFIRPKNVLILGAGSGNDAAAALRMGVKDVTAVDIDPFIASLGKHGHPEKPYLNPNAHIYIDDARSFIKKSDKKYDLITFGYLDAHAVLSQFSNVRLDNFIYTKESFRDIKNHLSDSGMVSLTYLVFKNWVAAKLYTGLKEVFQDDLKVFRTGTYDYDDTAIFLAGPGVRTINAEDISKGELYYGFDAKAKFITDDWPYLYLTKKGIPSHYLVIIVLVSVIAFLSVTLISKAPLTRFNHHFFFLGAGFMLLEAVGITRFALLFGSTWIVNSIVIISILIMILLANLYVEKKGKVNVRVVYILLMLAILLNWLLKPEYYLVLNSAMGIVLSCVCLSLPMLFASLIFATSFKSSGDIPGVFAYNLLGAIVGGFCEYVSMLAGFNSLFIIAMVLYYLSYRGMAPDKF